MKLLLDFGNTRCKWATIDKDQWRSGDAITYDTENRVAKLLAKLPAEQCSEIHAVSVLGADFDEQFSQGLHAQTGIDMVFHESRGEGYGVRLGCTDPASYGSDRYAALVAAKHATEGTKLVVDCGTAVTLDMIDSQGLHMGGLIMPGAKLMHSMLAEKASGIVLSDIQPPVQFFNHNTHSAVHSGSMLCLQYGLRSIMDAMCAMVAEGVSVFVTGGDSSTLLDLSNNQFIVRPELVLEGLEIMQRA